MKIADLKKLVHKDLTGLKQDELKEKIEQNKKLKEITIYTAKFDGKRSQVSDKVIKYLDENGVKYNEKCLEENPEIRCIINSNNNEPIVYVNGTYLVHGREFNNPQVLVNALQFYASPDYVDPDFEDKVFEMLKNMASALNMQMNNHFRNFTRQLAPIHKLVKILEEEEKEENEQKNK